MSVLRSMLLTAGPALLLIAGAPSHAQTKPQPQAASIEAPKPLIGSIPASPEARQVDLAQRLTAAGALFYGAYWCPHCNHQKDLFGAKGSAYLPYVECDRDNDGRRRCQKAAVRVYPTWAIGAERREGVLSLEELEAWLTALTPSSRP
jgi:hypothetical protein